MYLVTKKTIVVEENFKVNDTHLDAERLKKGLESGDLNIVKVETNEALRWVINKSGRRVAVLKNDGGCNSEDCEIKVWAPGAVKAWEPPVVYSVEG